MEDAEAGYVVLVNGEGQYSLWPDHKAVPSGWRLAGCAGSKADCLAFVEAEWTDMRPLSLRSGGCDRTANAARSLAGMVARARFVDDLSPQDGAMR